MYLIFMNDDNSKYCIYKKPEGWLKIGASYYSDSLRDFQQYTGIYGITTEKEILEFSNSKHITLFMETLDLSFKDYPELLI